MRRPQASCSGITLRLLIVIAMLTVSVAGCGQKGGLTRPQPVPDVNSPAPSPGS